MSDSGNPLRLAVMMFTKIRLYVLMGIAAVLLVASVNHVTAKPSPIAVVIVTDRSDSAMTEKYDKIVDIIERIRDMNKLQTRDLRIITYDYNDSAHRKYCNSVLDIYKRELLCVGISPLLGPSLKTGKMVFKLPLVTKPVDDALSVMKYAKRYVPDLKIIKLDTAIEFTSDPSGAQVFIDGNPMGQTPYQSVVEPGNHSIVVYKAGYRKYVENIISTYGENKTVNAKLEIAMIRKTDSTTGLSVAIPDSWVFMANTLDSSIFFMQRGDNKDIEGIITYSQLGQPWTARGFAEEFLDREKHDSPDGHYSEVSDTMLAGLPAAAFTKTVSALTLIDVVAVKDGKLLALILWAPNDLLASVQGEFDSIKNSVRFGGGGQTQVQRGGNGNNMIVVSAKVNLAVADKPSEAQQVGNPPQKALIFRDVAITVELPGTGAVPHRETMIMVMDATRTMAFIFTPDKPVTSTTKANVTVTRQGYKPLEFTGLDILPSGDHMPVNLPPLTFTK